MVSKNKKKIFIIVNNPIFIYQHLLPIIKILKNKINLFIITPFEKKFKFNIEGINTIHLPIYSALMGHTGIVAHSLPGRGNVERAARILAHPRAEHHQNVAAAPSARGAMAMVALSPAHLKNLLCERCTHASIGASLEPVIDRIPRLFVTWELLAFPQGEPREIDDYNR